MQERKRPQKSSAQNGDGAGQQSVARQDSAGPGSEPDALTKAMDWPGLWVYQRRDGEDGVWTPPFGDLPLPPGWEFLPPGDAFVTRQVKAGPHWILKGKLHRKGRYHPLIGYYAPAATISDALAAAETTKARREQSRERSARGREQAEREYRDEFLKACLRFLAFVPKHSELALRVAQGATDRACQKYSGRVGRTQTIPLEERAALAVRAYVRHRHTRYERRTMPGDEESYSEARSRSHGDVDKFLARHRPEGLE